MPPTPGQLHQLPVKVLYQLDSTQASNSFVTVLSELQSVYVHPQRRRPAGNDGGELYASCALKPIGRAVCFASPELVPVPSHPDSSLYILDPREVHRPRSRSTSPSVTTTHYPIWAGKGLLSWLLAEPEPGKSLAIGRLTRSWEFAPSSGSFTLDDQGGLEGLMAAANARTEEDEDGMGWGLEIALSLRESKNPSMGRQELHETLDRGLDAGDRSSPAVPSGPRHQVQVPLPAPPRPQPVRAAPPQAKPLDRAWQTGQAPASAPAAGHSWQSSNKAAPPVQKDYTRVPSTGSSQNVQTRPNAPKRPEPEASGSNWSRSSPVAHPPRSQPPQRPAPAPSNLSQPAQPSPLSQSLQPAPTPPSPSQMLAQLLPALKQAGNSLSPELARQISANPGLLKLLKSMAPNATPTGLSPNESKPSPVGSTNNTPMPTSTPAAAVLDGPSGSTTIHSAEPCYNCGTRESACWRTKKLRDGQSRKVCDECGMYFNQHKKMRPKELWSHQGEAHMSTPVPESQPTSSTAAVDSNSDSHPAKRVKVSHTPGPAPPAVRSSPRHAKTPGRAQTTPRKASQGRHLPPPPPSPSPRRSTRSTVVAKTPSPRKSHKAEPPSSGRTRAGAALARACGAHDLRSGGSSTSQRDRSTTPTPNAKASRTASAPAAHATPTIDQGDANDTEWATDFSAWTMHPPPGGQEAEELFDFHFPVEGDGNGTGEEGGDGLVMTDDIMALLSEIGETGG